MRDRVEVYGEGGFKPDRPDRNIVEEYEVEVPPEEANRRTVQERIEAALEALEQADANWTELTAAQRTAAMRLAVRVSAKLARLALGRFEAS
jgi:hypothetical protein